MTSPRAPRRSWGTAWNLLGSRAALSQRSAALLFLISLAAVFGSDVPRFGTPVPLWILSCLAGQAGIAAAYAAGSAVLFRGGRTRTAPAAALLVICIGVTLRPAILLLTASALGLTPGADLATRFLAGAVGGAIVSPLLAIVVAEQYEHRALVDSLRTQRSRLASLEGSLMGRIEELRRSLRQTVRATIEPNLVQVEAILRGLDAGSDRDAAAASLRAVIDGDLRPLSHELAASHLESERSIDSAIHEAQADASRAWPRTIRIGDLGAPVPNTIVLFILVLLFSQTVLPRPEAAVFAATGALATGLLLTGTRRLMRGVRLSTIASVPIAILASAVAGGIVTLAFRSLGLGLAPSALFLLPAGAAVVALAQASLSLLAIRRAAIEADLAEVVDRLRQSIAVLRQEEWTMRRRLAAVLHGSVQSALHSAAIRLSITSAVDQALLADIRHDLEAAVARLDEPDRATSIDEELSALAALWGDACCLEWNVCPSALELVAMRPALAECAVEIIREAVGNAVRHGRATTVTARVGAEGKTLRLVVSDNGSGPGPGTMPGLGSSLLDELTLEWSLQRDGDMTELHALLGV